ncbi:MAG: radical SAM family heme chaperone HemW [Syntrophomonadaceae bacterium]
MTRDTPALSLYIHIPFCLQKCRYCDFLSLPRFGSSLLDDYTMALLTEIKLKAPPFRERSVDTVYLGGGTPSLLDGDQINRVILRVRDHFNLYEDVEVSLEANPATVTRDKLMAFRDAGVNRISLGVQSFIDSDLKRLGRRHRVKDALQTVEDLHQLEWTNFNLDLIYGLPGQSIAGWLYNLETAIGLQPAHLSTYLLQLDPATPLGRELSQGLWQEASEEQLAAMYHQTRGLLARQGFIHYELSNYCRPGQECRHNMAYWQGRPYLGLGSGAVGCIDGRRIINPWPPADYIDALKTGVLPPEQVLEVMDQREQLSEAMVMGLRLIEGVSLEEIAVRLGIHPRAQYARLIDEFIERAWLIESCGKLRLNPELYFVSNQVLCHFID